MSKEYWMIDQLEKLANNWDRASAKLGKVHVEVNDVTYGKIETLNDCSAVIRNMCEEFRAECGVNQGDV